MFDTWNCTKHKFSFVVQKKNYPPIEVFRLLSSVPFSVIAKATFTLVLHECDSVNTIHELMRDF